MTVLALDVGGARLKASDGRAHAQSVAFPLWQRPGDLVAALAGIIAVAPACNRIVATMTGELADCFATKAEGVASICAALAAASAGRILKVYLTDGSAVSCEEACERPLAAAASNWHVLARFAGRFAPRGNALLIDIGSTTCDVVPLADGQPVPRGLTDTERLMCAELVYTGVERSPVCAIVGALPYAGGQCPVAQEFFATAGDAYRILGELPEEPDNTSTADGRPATRAFARERLARCVCADRTTFSFEDATAAATAIAAAQQAKIGVAVQTVMRRMVAPSETIIVSGQGEFLARAVIGRLRSAVTVLSLTDRIGPMASRVAPAYALAVLARELNW